MKKTFVLGLSAVLIFFAAPIVNASVIADWTFETSQPSAAGTFIPEIGSGSASINTGGSITSPTGNGSSHSFSSTAWNVNDYFQFSVSAIGFGGIQISFDQTSSSSGPAVFGLFYSVNGGAYTQFGARYNVLENGSPNPTWSSTIVHSVYNLSFDLSSITALNNESTVAFRLVDESTTAAGGGIVGTTGTDRVDNFIITGNALPAPDEISTFALATLGISVCLAFRRKINCLF